MKLFGYLAIALAFMTALLALAGLFSLIAVSLIATLTCAALFTSTHRVLKSFAFTVWVIVFVTASLFYPRAFGSWFGFDLGILIVPLIQIIMFGMGTTLNVGDFTRVAKMPWPVFIGLVLQFSVMPFAGLGIAMLFGFEPEVAAGVILIGSCPGGVASNLMTFIAGGNVALSVTMTSCSTLASPVMTPLLMKTLADKLVDIDFVDMMLSILNMIIVPIIAGLLANKILYSKHKVYHSSIPLTTIAIFGIGLAVVFGFIPGHLYTAFAKIKSGLVLGFALIGVVALVKWIINILLKGPENWMDKALPLVSMAGICFIIAIITARSSEKLLSVGLLLILAAIMHNFIGYILGYWFARLLKLEERNCRTIAFEVGMQNGGMASGLAMTVLKSASAALAPAIFGPWMNISGSVLANYWQKNKPVENKWEKQHEQT
ncbi:bile acid:sodium symporter family protein [candidate division KSB1 bacterium]|nr:bile acid:sodium symporter family protein [candidate division KSB1 bacterium]